MNETTWSWFLKVKANKHPKIKSLTFLSKYPSIFINFWTPKYIDLSAPPRPKHSVVLASLSHGGYAAFDFVPAAAEDPMVALQLLLGALTTARTTEGRKGSLQPKLNPKSHGFNYVYSSHVFFHVFFLHYVIL